MSKGKTISKSVRLTEEIYTYVDGYQGDCFNQRFENLIVDAMLGEADRIRCLNDLDRRIAERQKELKKLLSDCEVITRIRRQAMYVERDIDALRQEVSKIIPEQG